VQLRTMFALEAGLVAAVAGPAGVALGTPYGWAGTAALLGGSVDSLRMTAPTGQLVALVAVAVGAGLLASAAPRRRQPGPPPS
jgi:putative ABC transport system permease protein